MVDITVRVAKESDIAKLLPLLLQLGYPTSLPELTARFRKFNKLTGYGIAVCVKGAEILGFIAWSSSYLFVSDKTRFRVEGIVVDERYRFMRVGKKLMQFVEEIATNQKPSIIELTSGLRREKDGSHEFYKKLGYSNE